MPKSVRKITLSQSRDIPFNRLVLSQSNVRRFKAGVSIEELAQDIARRTFSKVSQCGLFSVRTAVRLACSRPGTSRPCARPGRAGRATCRSPQERRDGGEAQELLAGFGWPPEPLRTPGRAIAAVSATCDVELGSPVESSGESATTGYETAMTDFERSAEDQRSRQSRPLSRPSS